MKVLSVAELTAALMRSVEDFVRHVMAMLSCPSGIDEWLCELTNKLEQKAEWIGCKTVVLELRQNEAELSESDTIHHITNALDEQDMSLDETYGACRAGQLLYKLFQSLKFRPSYSKMCKHVI